jgi:DNA-binding IclR family transcriptional regulator
MSNVKSVERAIEILLCFTREYPAMDVGQLQRKLGIARPTLYRMLRTLESKGLVRAVGEPRRYELGHNIMQLANVWLSNVEVNRIAQPVLETLRRASEETIALNLPISEGARMCAIELPSKQALAFSLGIGHIQPMHIGASGKAILAFSSPDKLDAALNEAGVRSLGELKSQLTQIRKSGYAVTSSEIIAGAVAIAAPVFDRYGDVIASVSIVGPEARLKGADRQQAIELVKRAAHDISLGLGHAVERKGPGSKNI